MRTLTGKGIQVAVVATIALLFGSHAAAHGIDFDWGGLLDDDKQGLGDWSHFEGKLQQHLDSLPARDLGEWLEERYPRRGDELDEVIGKNIVAQIGIERRARLMRFKEKFLAGIMMVLRFKHHLFAHYDYKSEPVPLPAGALLFGSALAGLTALRRKKSRSEVSLR